MLIYCFEDERVEKLAPIIHARPAYAITCAGYRLVDWLDTLRRENGNCSLVGEIREYLARTQHEDYGVEGVADSVLSADAADQHDVLLVNARLTPSVKSYRALQAMIRSSRPVVAMAIDEDTEPEVEPTPQADRRVRTNVLAAWLPAAEVATALARDDAGKDPSPQNVSLALARHAVMTAERSEVPMGELAWPHDVVAAHMQCMHESTEHRIATRDYTQLQDGVFVGKDVVIGDYESIHTDGGAIVLEDNVNVGPFCFLEGPLYAGRNTRVIEHSSIKDGVSLGHTTKIGGEVEASVIESYSNKQHHGFLGHSYLGSWINLGAGTCNSDLKNTYGKINIQYGDEKVASGMQFLGCIMGDYSKSAINTGIFTGKVIGVCSMMYGFVTGNVPSYVNYARLFGQTSLLPPEVMVNTQARMFARRKVKQRPADIALIHAMYHRTESERRSSDQLGF